MTIAAAAAPLERRHNSFIPLLKSLTFLWSSQLAESFSLHWSARTRRIKQDWMNAPKVPRIVALALSPKCSQCSPHNALPRLFPRTAHGWSPTPTAPAPCGRVKRADKYPPSRRTESCRLEEPGRGRAAAPLHVCLGGREVVICSPQGHIILSSPSPPPLHRLVLRKKKGVIPPPKKVFGVGTSQQVRGASTHLEPTARVSELGVRSRMSDELHFYK